MNQCRQEPLLHDQVQLELELARQAQLAHYDDECWGHLARVLGLLRELYADAVGPPHGPAVVDPLASGYTRRLLHRLLSEQTARDPRAERLRTSLDQMRPRATNRCSAVSLG